MTDTAVPVDIYIDGRYGDGAALARFRAAFSGDFPGFSAYVFGDEHEFRARLPAMHHLLALFPPTDAWHSARRLKLLHGVGAGIDNLLPLDGLPASVQVANMKGLSAEPMAEFALTLVMMQLKGINAALDAQRRREWNARLVPGVVAGSTLGILGCGQIGAVLARRAVAMGMRVIATQRRPKQVPHVEAVFALERTADVLAAADAVVCLLPLTPRTRGALDAALLRRMKRGACFVNLARGGIVDETELQAMLRDGHLAAAAADVFDTEPLPADHPLWSAPNFVLTPHVAGGFAGATEAIVARFLDNVRRVEAGLPPTTRVDLAEGY